MAIEVGLVILSIIFLMIKIIREPEAEDHLLCIITGFFIFLIFLLFIYLHVEYNEQQKCCQQSGIQDPVLCFDHIRNNLKLEPDFIHKFLKFFNK